MREFAAQQCKARADRTGLIDLMHALNAHIAYEPGITEVDTSAAEAFAGRPWRLPGPYSCLPRLRA
jgi:transglutaminase-like putative cysteine protease